MKILLIEDEIAKEKDILKYLKEINYNEVTVKHSITSGIAEIREHHYNYILLDMSLPIFDTDDATHFDDNEFETFGGNFVLEELDRCDYKAKVIVITAFDILGEGSNRIELQQVEQGLFEDYPDVFAGAVFYDASSVEWKNRIRELLA